MEQQHEVDLFTVMNVKELALALQMFAGEVAFAVLEKPEILKDSTEKVLMMARLILYKIGEMDIQAVRDSVC